MLRLLAHVAYLSAALGLALSVPVGVLAAHSGVVVTLGFIGLWRYGWAVINFVRAHLYIRHAYPHNRDRLQAIYADTPHKAHAYFLATTYKIDTDVSLQVYRSTFAAACRVPGGATVVASVVSEADERLVRMVFARFAGTVPTVQLIVDRIAGTGKRDALAESLKTIARQHPHRNDIVLLIDGDTKVPVDIVEQAAPFFLDPKVGALTTDERSETIGSAAFRDWFDLRFAQRQMMMSAVALGGRVLTLTGRMSLFRADLATNPDFVAAVRNDYIDHWRFGRVQFLTGDDKSTWFWLLKNGYQMVYMPDVQSVAMESQPKPGFVESATTLMTRWFGNMLRTNGRALQLGPRQVGWFTWWSILDQRVSMWTTLTGPAAAILFSLFSDPMVLVAYLSWVMMTRYVNCLLLQSFHRGFPISYPFLLYFGQIAGAVTKVYVLFRLDRQRWTRQATSSRSLAGLHQRVQNNVSVYMHALAIGWFLAGLAILSGFFSFS